jgi:CRP/FNR family cyclic AMP-dependent transcriptional regulator
MTTAQSPRSSTIALLDADPDLGFRLNGDRKAAAAHVTVKVDRLWPGPWRRSHDLDAANGDMGLLLLEGIMVRRLCVHDTVSAELLGPGDLIRPAWSSQTDSLLHARARWSVLSAARVALLDARVAAELATWPEIVSALLDRLSERAERIAVTRAIGQLTGVDRRLLALFWHLAERWGRVQRTGVLVPLCLTHRLLGQLVGAHRPTVTTALRLLAERRVLVRTRDGSWLLCDSGEARRLSPACASIYDGQ